MGVQYLEDRAGGQGVRCIQVGRVEVKVCSKWAGEGE